jgi:hypothetical protein
MILRLPVVLILAPASIFDAVFRIVNMPFLVLQARSTEFFVSCMMHRRGRRGLDLGALWTPDSTREKWICPWRKEKERSK